MAPPPPDPLCDGPTDALTANELLESAAVVIVCLRTDPTTRRHVPIRALAFAVTLPVRDSGGTVWDGAEPGEDVPPDNATPQQIEAVRVANRDRARRNYKALQRLFRVVAAFGGGRVRLPDLRDGDGERIPFLWLADVEITEGVEFIIDGLLKVPTGGLDDDWFRDIDNEKRYPKHTCVTFASGIAYAAISGTGIVDGNASGNVATVPLDWLQPLMEDPDNPGQQITNWAEDGPAKCRCNGIVWGPTGERGDGDGTGEPPRFVRIEGITSCNHLRNCFVGSLSNVYLANATGGDAWTDHVFYFADGEKATFARTRNTGTGAVDLNCFGFWQGGAIQLADGYVHGLTVRDVAPNPIVTHVSTDPLNEEDRPYGARRLQAVVGPRPFKVGGGVLGLLVMADLALLESVVGLRGRGFEVDGEVFHTGAHNLYYTGPISAPTATGTPCRLVDVGRPYAHTFARGCRVRLRAHRLPGKTVLFENPAGRPVYDLDARFTVDYHPDTKDEGDLVVLNETAERVRVHVEAWERAPAGGGPGRFVVIADTGAPGTAKTDTPAEPYQEAPTPRALGVHGVEVSGRVHTGRDATWAAFVRHERVQGVTVEVTETAPTVSGLAARDLTVVMLKPANQSTTQVAQTALLRRWRHERVDYRMAVPAPAPSSLPWTGWITLDAARVREQAVDFAHGIPASPTLPAVPDRLDVVAIEVKETGTGGSLLESPLYGARLDFDPTVNEAAVYFDPAAVPTDEPNAAKARLKFHAERYDRARGDVLFEATVTTNGSLGPHAVAYPAGLALAAPPRVWHTVRTDTGAVLQSVPTADAAGTPTGFSVTFNATFGIPIPASIPVQITARVG